MSCLNLGLLDISTNERLKILGGREKGNTGWRIYLGYMCVLSRNEK